MPRSDVEFKTSDRVTLRGWFYTPESATVKQLPCIILSHGWSALKEMHLDDFAEYFVQHLPVACLVYDHRGFGDSDTGPNQPRQEIIPAVQMADMSDAITYAQSRQDVDLNKIAIWGSSYSGGHVLQVGAVDRRVKVVLSQVPLVSGWETSRRLIRPDAMEEINFVLQQDRLSRAAGNDPIIVPVVSEDPKASPALSTTDAYKFFVEWASKSKWKNENTLRSMEAARAYDPSAWIHRISPTPLLMMVAQNDILTPTDLALEAYERARQPKELHILPGGHFDLYSGPNFEPNAGKQVEFLKKHLL